MSDNININKNGEFDIPETAQPAQYSWNNTPQPESSNEESPVMIRRRVKSGYNWAGSLILWQQLFAMIGMVIFQMIYSAMVMPSIIADNPELTAETLTAELTARMSGGSAMILMNSVCMLAANILAIIIVYFASKKFKFKEMFSKTDFPSSGIVLAALGIFGIQGFSILVQTLVTNLTGYTGMSETTSSALSFTDNIVTNIVLLLYVVVAAPILEEIMFRGLAMNLLAPVNRTFALIASSLFFGLMHANFNQIFNGFLLGMLLGYIALKSGSIISSMICHIVANANAMLLSYIFEHKLADTIGEKAYTYEFIAFAAELVIGGIALFFMLKKYGRVNQSDIITTSYTYEFEQPEEKKLTWNALLKSPTFWVSAVICLGSACLMLTQVTVS